MIDFFREDMGYYDNTSASLNIWTKRDINLKGNGKSKKN